MAARWLRLALAAGLLACTAPTAQDAPAVPSAQDATALRERAFAAEKSGDHAAAADAFLLLAAQDRDEKSWFVHAAENLAKSGRFNDAMDLLDGVRGRFAQAPEILVVLARLYHQKADTMVQEGGFDVHTTFYYEDAARTAELVLAADAKHVQARLVLASARFQLGDLDAALREAETAVSASPDDYGAQAMLGKVMLQRYVNGKQRLERDGLTGPARDERQAALDADRERAVEALRRAARADQERSFPLVKLGDVLAWSGDVQGALAQYRAALAVEPAATLDHVWLRSHADGPARRTLYIGALDDYRARGGKDPRASALLQWYAAQAEFDAEQWSAALELFAAALQARPDFVSSYTYLMQAAYWANDLDAAAKWAKTFAAADARAFADSIRRDERATAILRGVAQRQFEAGQLPDCRELNRVLAIASNTAIDWNNFALLCRDTGKYRESLEAYETALEIERSPQLLNDAAVILHYHLPTPENLALARDRYERAIELGEAMLRDKDLDADARERTTTAIRDAKNNLRALRGN